MNGGVQVIAQLLGKKHRLVLQVDELAFRGGIPQPRFLGEGRVLLPCAVGGILRRRKKLRRIDGAEQGITKAHFGNADVVQDGDGADAFLVHLRQPFNERLEHGGGVGVPQLHELILGHAADGGKVCQGFTAGGGGNLHLHQRLGKGRAAHLGFHAHGGQRSGEAENLCFRQADLLARTGETERHLHDGGLGRGEVVAQIHQRGAEVLEQPLFHAHDVGELRQRGARFLGNNIRGVAQVDHDAGEVLQSIRANAQLSGVGHDVGDFGGVGSDLGGHPLDGAFQLFKLRLGGIHRLAYPREGGLKLDAGLHRCRAQRQHRRSDHGGERAPDCAGGLADGIAVFGEIRHGLARRRPQGTGGIQLTVGVPDGGFRFPDSGLRVGQGSFGIRDRIGGFPDFLRIIDLLRGDQLFPGRFQLFLILCHRLLMQGQLLVQHDQLGRQRACVGVHILDARRCQPEAALCQLHLLAEGSDSGIRRLHAVTGGLPVRLGKPQGFAAAPDGLFRFAHSRLRFVQLRLLGGNGIRRILSCLAQGVLLPGEFVHLLGRRFIFLLGGIHVGLGGNGGRVAFSQTVPIPGIGRSGILDFIPQGALALSGLLQPQGVIVLAVVALGQLGGGLFQRPLILRDHILLQGQLALQRRQLSGQPLGRVLEVVQPGGSQLEIRLRFLDLFVDRPDVAGEVFGVQ